MTVPRRTSPITPPSINKYLRRLRDIEWAPGIAWLECSLTLLKKTTKDVPSRQYHQAIMEDVAAYPGQANSKGEENHAEWLMDGPGNEKLFCEDNGNAKGKQKSNMS
jgi:hypothetical protein